MDSDGLTQLCTVLYQGRFLSQVRNLKWLTNKLEKLIATPIFFSGRSHEDTVSGVSGRVPVYLLSGQKDVLMVETVATERMKSDKQDCKMR